MLFFRHIFMLLFVQQWHHQNHQPVILVAKLHVSFHAKYVSSFLLPSIFYQFLRSISRSCEVGNFVHELNIFLQSIWVRIGAELQRFL